MKNPTFHLEKCYIHETLGRVVECQPQNRARINPGLAEGYDVLYNQIVICNGSASSPAVLVHELLHMYDHCTADMDFGRPDHLACTEVRAAALADCTGGSTTSHRDCVRERAVKSVMAISGVGEEGARTSVAGVFEKCYRDLEPIGRRCYGYSDQYRAWGEYRHFFRTE